MRTQAPARIRRWQATLIITLVFTAAVGAAAIGWWYARESPPHQGPIVLVSVDGLASSALATYGAGVSAAPAIDALAADSVLFERAYVHSPQILPAHTSLLTGRLPLEHGVRDDAGFALSQNARTLAELLRSRGFSTGAAVSSFLLRRDTGLSQGFGFFDGDLGDDDGGNPALERSGGDTLEAASRWVRQQGGQRFLLFLEIPAAGADAAVGGLVALLKDRRLFEEATIVLVGGRGVVTSTGALDDGALRVPFLVKQPGREGAGRRIAAPVQHIDILPTVLDLVRAPMPGGLRGRSLRPVLDDSDATVPLRPIYAESMAARFRFGGRPVSALVSDGRRLVRDGAETLTAGSASDLPNPTPSANDPAPLRDELDRLERIETAAAPVPVSADDEDRLLTLGILMAPRGLPEASPDALPMDQTALLESHRRVARLIGQKQFAEAVRALQALARANPALPALQYQLGSLLARAGRLDESIAAYRDAGRSWPDSLPVALALARTLTRAGRLDLAQAEAETALMLAESGGPAERVAALEAAARIALDKRDVETAEKYAEAAFETARSPALRQFVRGRVQLTQGEYEEARAALAAALPGSPDAEGTAAPMAGLHLSLGEALVHLERPDDAEAEFKAEIRAYPGASPAYVSLAALYRSLGREEDVERVLNDLVVASPTPEGAGAAARAWAALGDPRRADALRTEARRRFKGDPSLALLGRARP